jgi:hypothetical protein
MKRGVDRTGVAVRPGGAGVLLASLLLVVSASGCGQLEDSLDSLALHLEDSVPHRHDTAGRSGRGTPSQHPAPVREQAVPAVRSARVRGTIIAGLAVSRVDSPAADTGLQRYPPGQEPAPVARRAVLGAPRQESRAGRGREVLLGFARGTPQLSRLVLPDPLRSRPGTVPVVQLIARLDATGAPPRAAEGDGWKRRSHEVGSRASGHPGVVARGSAMASARRVAVRPRPVLSGGASGRRSPREPWVIRLDRGRHSGGLRPEHLHASARRGRVARVSPGPGWRLAGGRPEWDVGRVRPPFRSGSPPARPSGRGGSVSSGTPPPARGMVWRIRSSTAWPGRRVTASH